MGKIYHGHTIGHVQTPEYMTWCSVIYRCKRPPYSTRGITVCERWRTSFEAFLSDMGHKPSPTHSIDRINSGGNYEPGNCRWATPIEQASNRSFARRICALGETHTAAEWGRRYGLPAAAIINRIDKLGWPEERAVTEPLKRNRRSRQLQAPGQARTASGD